MTPYRANGMVWYGMGDEGGFRMGILRFIQKATPVLPLPMSSCTINGPLWGWENRPC